MENIDSVTLAHIDFSLKLIVLMVTFIAATILLDIKK